MGIYYIEIWENKGRDKSGAKIGAEL